MVADCDLRVSLHAKRWFDAVGHYSREDVLARLVMRRERGRAAGRRAAEPRRVRARRALIGVRATPPQR